MGATVWAFANHKGGVGKTTSALNISAAFARAGRRVLMVDLDAQANLTASATSAHITATTYGTLAEGAPLPRIDIAESLQLAPAGQELANAEAVLCRRAGNGAVLRNALLRERERYNDIILDCPPAVGIITQAAIFAADVVCVPLTAEALPFAGLASLLRLVGDITEATGTRKRLAIFATRWQARGNLRGQVWAGVEARHGADVCATKVRECIKLAEAQLMRQSVFMYAPTCNGAKDYAALAEELLRRVNLPPSKPITNSLIH